MTIAALIVEALRDPAVRAELRAALGVSTGDPWVPLADAASELGVKPRVLADAGRRGELEIGGAGRARVVRRSELDRYVAARGVVARVVAEDDSSNVASVTSIAKAAARLRRASA